MKAIILATGEGCALYPYTKYTPPCLLDVGCTTILNHQINHMRDSGIDEVIIVVGFGFEKVENFLRNYDGLGMRIKILYNPFYRTTNSLVSLWIATSEMHNDVVIIKGDNLFGKEVLEQVLKIGNEKLCLLINRKSSCEEEDMKKVTQYQNVVEIGNALTNLPFVESAFISIFRDTGVALIKKAIEEEIRTEGAKKKEYVSAIHRLIKKGYKGYKVKSLDIGDLFWMDLDYTTDPFKARVNSNRPTRKSHREKILRIVKTNPQ